uniref:Uncharacterized protein n=1 Tax=Aegilops tauschii TaxID=37682 RepID=R7WFA2_AEGTA
MAGVGAAENEDGVGRRGRLAGRNSRSKEAVSPWREAHWPEQQEQLPPLVPMRCSPRLDCSSFFAGGVLVRCSSLRVLDEHCRLSWFLPVVSCIDSRIFLPLPLRLPLFSSMGRVGGGTQPQDVKESDPYLTVNLEGFSIL